MELHVFSLVKRIKLKMKIIYYVLIVGKMFKLEVINVGVNIFMLMIKINLHVLNKVYN